MSYACNVRGLSKCYRVDRSAPRGRSGYKTLRDDLARIASSPLRAFRNGGNGGRSEEFWALRDVSFEIQPGEVIGIIGRNGAGKSTLLKVLSRITKPTAGRVELNGRVGSLLEVGTGFHPELTGRENIYLNGAILGMSRREISRKFDEIVSFAEVEKFLDTPVKRYSSGMYVRLAFAVAAYLEPEILIVDEVLAVGDMAFQRKCMGRMHEVGRGGSTVLFVSHNMPAVESLCTRAILLDSGTVVQQGDVREQVAEYRRRLMGSHDGQQIALADLDAPGRKLKVFRSAAMLDAQGEPTNHLPLGGEFRMRLTLDSPRAINFPTVTIGVDDNLGQRMISLCTPLRNPVIETLDGVCEVECRVPNFPLAPGEYWIKLGLATVGEQIDDVERATMFTVLNGDAFNEGRGIHQGVCVAPTAWTVDAVGR